MEKAKLGHLPIKSVIMKSKYIIMLMFFLSMGPLFAGEITGIVKDSKGNPVANIQVVAMNKGNQKVAMSNAGGVYFLNGLAAGSYTVIAMGFGVNDTVLDVAVYHEGTRNLDLMIYDKEMMTIEVNGGTRRSPLPLIDPYNPGHGGGATQIDMKNAGIRKVEAVAALMPKTYVSETGEISLVGSRPSATRIMIDGVYSVVQVPTRAIRYVKVLGSGIPAKYGDTSGGIILIETRSYFD